MDYSFKDIISEDVETLLNLIIADYDLNPIQRSYNHEREESAFDHMPLEELINLRNFFSNFLNQEGTN